MDRWDAQGVAERMRDEWRDDRPCATIHNHVQSSRHQQMDEACGGRTCRDEQERGVPPKECRVCELERCSRVVSLSQVRLDAWRRGRTGVEEAYFERVARLASVEVRAISMVDMRCTSSK